VLKTTAVYNWVQLNLKTYFVSSPSYRFAQTCTKVTFVAYTWTKKVLNAGAKPAERTSTIQ
jgi:hypothetical protein